MPIKNPKSQRIWLWILIGVALILTLGVIALFLWPAQSAMRSVVHQPGYDKTVAPEFEVQTILGGLDHPWDIAFLHDGKGIFTERNGTLSLLDNGIRSSMGRIDDVKVAGEGGLLGLAVDSDAANNRLVYVCYNTKSDIRVVRYKLNETMTGLADKVPIVTGMPSTAGGRHSGCRMAFGPDGNLWIGTGDSAQGYSPQDPRVSVERSFAWIVMVRVRPAI